MQKKINSWVRLGVERSWDLFTTNKRLDVFRVEKGEEKCSSMYPLEWWWAERQVNDILAEHPGELGQYTIKDRQKGQTNSIE